MHERNNQQRAFVPISLKRTLVFASAVAAAMYVWRNPYLVYVLSSALVMGIIAIGASYSLLVGRVNLGQTAFALVGGYAAASLTIYAAIPPEIALLLGGAASAAFGLALGPLVMRMKGLYFAMLTLTLNEVVRLAIENSGTRTGGNSGLTNLSGPALYPYVEAFAKSFISAFSSDHYYLILVTILVLVCLFCTDLIRSSEAGRTLEAMRQNEVVAQSFGVAIERYRLFVFSIGCGLAGLGGATFAMMQQNIFPNTFTLTDSITVVLFVIFGGSRIVVGPVVGAVALLSTSQALQAVGAYQELFYSCVLILTIMLLPNGILHGIGAALANVRRSPGTKRHTRKSGAYDDNSVG